MSSNDYRTIVRNGLWDNNVVFSQMLALCPLLAVTSTATNGLGMGIASTVVMIASSLAVSIARGFITKEVRLPIFVLLIASIVTLVDMYMNAWMHELHKVLGLFIPLIVTNCAILGRAESFAFHQSPSKSIVDGLFMGIGFTIALVCVGATREIIGSGTLFANASLLLGDAFTFMELTLIPEYGGFLLMILPPGAFIALGFILAAKRILDARRSPVLESRPSMSH
jgi:electron transport complex protein RnfE